MKNKVSELKFICLFIKLSESETEYLIEKIKTKMILAHKTTEKKSIISKVKMKIYFEKIIFALQIIYLFIKLSELEKRDLIVSTRGVLTDKMKDDINKSSDSISRTSREDYFKRMMNFHIEELTDYFSSRHKDYKPYAPFMG